MTKAIAVLIILVVIYGGYRVFNYWEEYDKDQDIKAKEAETARHFSPESLAGMPQGLEKSYQLAQARGATGLREWLKAYGARVEDPRRAWIELDYVVQVAQTDPVEAKKIFAEVKARTPQDSKVYPRMKELEKTYE